MTREGKHNTICQYMIHVDTNTLCHRNTDSASSSGSHPLVIDEINKRGRDQEVQLSNVLIAISKLEKCVRAMEVSQAYRICNAYDH
jgi:hypothetical protein